jgi:hypothetical protein
VTRTKCGANKVSLPPSRRLVLHFPRPSAEHSIKSTEPEHNDEESTIAMRTIQ